MVMSGAKLPEKYKKFQQLLDSFVEALSEIKGDPGQPAPTVTFNLEDKNLIAHYSTGEKVDLGKVVGENGQDADYDEDLLIEKLLNKIEIPHVPSKEEILAGMPKLETIAKVAKGYLLEDKASLPVADPPSVEAIASYLVNENLLPCIEPDVIDIEEVIKAVLEEIEVPSAPTVAEVVDAVLPSIVNLINNKPAAAVDTKALTAEILNSIQLPDEEVITKKVLENIDKPNDGKDSPLVGIYNAYGNKATIQNSKRETLLEIPFTQGLYTVELTLIGSTADEAGAYVDKGRVLVLRCSGNQLKKIDEKVPFSVVSTHSKLIPEIAFTGNTMFVYGSGVSGTEARWSATALIQGTGT